MGKLTITGITHWSIPVNNLEDSEKFYGDLLGLEARGRLGNSYMSCFSVEGHNILLCRRDVPVDDVTKRDTGVHYSFNVSPETFDQAIKLFREENVVVDELNYRATGHFPGRELYFLDPSGNRLELRDVTWQKGMPEPAYDEIVS